LQHGIDSQLASVSQERDDVLLRSGKLVKLMSLEYAPLMADIYWTRVVQYLSNKHVRGKRISICCGRCWILRRRWIRTWSSRTGSARCFSARHLRRARAGRTRRWNSSSADSSQSGLWRLYEDLGFVYYFDLKDYPKCRGRFSWKKQEANAQVMDESNGRENCGGGRIVFDFGVPMEGYLRVVL